MADLESIEGAIGQLPKLGLVPEPTPLQPLPDLAGELGLGSLWVKQDDRIAAFGGGSKIRKLDYLLTQPPFHRAPFWQSCGAIGSGHLVALAQAARGLDRTLVAHCFLTELCEDTIENLALIASGPVEFHLYASRAHLVQRRPLTSLGVASKTRPVIPFGGTTPVSMVGSVVAGLELCRQVSAGDMPTPSAIYLAFGTGGTVAGLSVGLALGGCPIPLFAVSAVEPWLLGERRLRALQNDVLRHLEQSCGLAPVEPAPVELSYQELGAGYGHPTKASREAVVRFGSQHVALEAIYTGKAAAALASAARHRGQDVLLYNTRRGSDLRPVPQWRKRLPAELRRYLEQGRSTLGRRRWMFAAGAAVASSAVLYRCGFYPEVSPRTDSRSPRFLSARQAHILREVARVVLPPLGESALGDVTGNVDDYVSTLPRALQREVEVLFSFVEQGTLLSGQLQRLSRLGEADVDEHLRALDARGWLLRKAYRGLRDLCMLGFYQRPESWQSLGYTGPWVVPSGASPSPGYDDLRAPPRALPQGARVP